MKVEKLINPPRHRAFWKALFWALITVKVLATLFFSSPRDLGKTWTLKVCSSHFDFTNPIEKSHLQVMLQPTQFYCEEMRDVRTKINKGKD